MIKIASHPIFSERPLFFVDPLMPTTHFEVGTLIDAASADGLEGSLPLRFLLT
jgi:hypothetical protein